MPKEIKDFIEENIRCDVMLRSCVPKIVGENPLMIIGVLNTGEAETTEYYCTAHDEMCQLGTRDDAVLEHVKKHLAGEETCEN